MVIFGGNYGCRPPTNETWTWDGKVWRQQHPAVSPPARNSGVMAYDDAHHNVVLFGGLQMPNTRGGPTNLNDTWVWNGSNWQERHPQHLPAMDYDSEPPTMAFDPMTHAVLLHGISADRTLQTWFWNGQDWTQLSAAAGPQMSGTMASDGQRVLLVAGSNGMVGGRYITQTWAWDGSAWSLLHPSVELPSMEPPVGRIRHRLRTNGPARERHVDLERIDLVAVAPKHSAAEGIHGLHAVSSKDRFVGRRVQQRGQRHVGVEWN
jgi:hypothetical protein